MSSFESNRIIALAVFIAAAAASALAAADIMLLFCAMPIAKQQN